MPYISITRVLRRSLWSPSHLLFQFEYRIVVCNTVGYNHARQQFHGQLLAPKFASAS